MAAVQEGRREAWLGLFADDSRVEDPVGHLPPIVGRDALAQFWDQAIEPLRSVGFDVGRQWEAGAEAMLLATVTVVAPNGVEVDYDGTFNYAIGEDGRIASLRAFWDLPAVGAALAQDA
jgi:ketosteroid isomerase-like protein